MQRLPKSVQRWAALPQQGVQALVSLLFPRRCYLSGELLQPGEPPVSPLALARLPHTHFQLRPTDNLLFKRLNGLGGVTLAGAAAAWHYEKASPLQALIHGFKYYDRPGLAFAAGQYLGNLLHEADFLSGEEVVVPIPLHRSKLRKRGYNQAEHIAGGMGSVAGLQLRAGLLQRPVKTAVQAKMDRQGRWENVKAAFAVPAETRMPATVLVVDDVITTGATIMAAAATLQQAGVRAVKVAALAEVSP